MPRHVYEEDHEALRASAREFIERTMKPRASRYGAASTGGRTKGGSG